MTFTAGDWLRIFLQVVDRLPLTFLMIVVSLFFAIIIGLLFACIRIKQIPGLKQLAVIYLSFTRSTPLIVQLFLIYFGLPQLLLMAGIQINHWDRVLFVMITFSLHTGAYLSEVFRSAYSSVGKDQLEAAYIVGMTDTQALMRIIIPQAFLIALPNLGNYTIDLVKDTAIAFTIGLIDMMGQVKIILGNNYGIGMFEVYVIIAIVYWLICISIELITMLLERKFVKGRTSLSR
ncbi:amino acid ABC transporter permease [Bacillus altitudinis]|uniref:amino acid ABC transporter permease n=1 Tax=Bacillus altitudinis TaxID=293387 RepID=UPI00203E8E07|nr:amino acid ABC transporter permease [Bacillus altitudinis]MCM3062367.1 amino acid ABC transporter permease [Bacillus altitudinis]MCM3075071.1 amino acid ABC transporter permease [Bacillus altitudinis]